MANWTDAVAAEEFQDGARRLLRRNGHSIALFNLKGACYAIDDSCPHAGGSLVVGRLDGTTLQCPAHGLRFDVASGCQRGTAGLRVRTFPVRLNEGRIEVDLAPPAA
jgi:3-phenylpropionate/trans-cinnamate dioxygenase ferredoxin subunit